MTLPLNITAALDEAGINDPPEGVYARSSSACEGAKFHSPTPLVLHEVDIDGTTVALCGTCRDNRQVLVDLLVAQEGAVAWPVRREFGNLIRALAEKDYRAQVVAADG